MTRLSCISPFRRIVAIAAAATLVMVASASPASAVGGTPIDSAGPLTQILVGDDTQCQVAYAGDDDPEFYGEPDSGACGTFVALGGTLYGPEEVPAGDDAEPRTPFTPVSQSAVTGAGTTASPYKVTTVVDLGTSGFRLTETDSYVVGQEAYLTSVALTNTTGAAQSAVIYRAGDCYLQNSDDGFGQVDGNAVSCRSPENERIEQWFPITPGSTYMEDEYDTVWAAIGSQQPFANTCLCGQEPGDEHDNGAGLSWVRSIGAGQSTTVAHYTTFSPLGLRSPVVTKTADAAEVEVDATNGYTISVDNPGEFDITLDNITDDLPDGFSYVAGSTTGATTADPTVSGQTLTWPGPLTVPSDDSISLHFSVTVSGVPGTYTNSASATGPGIAVIGAVDVAPVVVTEEGGATTTTTTTTAAPTTTTAPPATPAPPIPLQPTFTG